MVDKFSGNGSDSLPFKPKTIDVHFIQKEALNGSQIGSIDSNVVFEAMDTYKTDENGYYIQNVAASVANISGTNIQYLANSNNYSGFVIASQKQGTEIIKQTLIQVTTDDLGAPAFQVVNTKEFAVQSEGILEITESIADRATTVISEIPEIPSVPIKMAHTLELAADRVWGHGNFEVRDCVNIPPGSVQIMAAFPCDFIEEDTSISVLGVGVEYRINGGPWTSVEGIVSNNQFVEMRIEADSLNNTTRTGTLIIGNMQESGSVTTIMGGGI